MTCNKLLQNVKTKWIDMLRCAKKVYVDHSFGCQDACRYY
jgi:hypothetical protein